MRLRGMGITPGGSAGKEAAEVLARISWIIGKVFLETISLSGWLLAAGQLAFRVPKKYVIQNIQEHSLNEGQPVRGFNQAIHIQKSTSRLGGLAVG
jgi:hypothetical protein